MTAIYYAAALTIASKVHAGAAGTAHSDSSMCKRVDVSRHCISRGRPDRSAMASKSTRIDPAGRRPHQPWQSLVNMKRKNGSWESNNSASLDVGR